MSSPALAATTVTARQRAGLPGVVAAALGVVALAVAAVGVVGSDALWLSALGNVVRRESAVPQGIPFAAAPSDGWVNTTVLGQLVFSAFHAVGSAGVLVAQLVAVTATLAVVAVEATRRGARPRVLAAVLLLVAVGAAAPLLVARAQLLSLVPYALLLALLRRQHERPDRGIWWSVPLLALWGNLHGAVLVGVAVLGCHLLLSRLRTDPWTAVAVGLASLAATCANPGLWHAPRYYAGVLTGAATGADAGMWSRPSLSDPLDLLLVVVTLALAVLALRRRRPAWEYVAAAGLVLATASAARHGVWLLLLLAVPAAASASSDGVTSAPQRAEVVNAGRRAAPATRGGAVTAVLALAVAVLVLAARLPTFRAADEQAARVVAATRGQTVLVAEPLAEAVAAAGGTVWLSNPLDAFGRADQQAYLAFLAGDASGARPALDAADVVVAASGSAQARLAAAEGFQPAGTDGDLVLMRRSP